MYANQVTAQAALEAVLQVPLQMPVFTREISSRMYSPTIYFLGRLLSQMILQIIPPTIIFAIIVSGIGMSTDLENLLWLYAFTILGNFTWSAMGFWVGIAVNDEKDGAKGIVSFLLVIFIAVNGIMVNTQTANIFVKFLGDYTPLRILCEAVLRCLTKDVPYLD